MKLGHPSNPYNPPLPPPTPTLGAQSLSHWTTREVPLLYYFRMVNFQANEIVRVLALCILVDVQKKLLRFKY